MRIEAHLPHATLARLLRELAPVRIHMAPPDGDQTRYLEIEEPSLIQPVPERGLRIIAAGRVRFDLAKVPLRIRIKKLALVLEPVIVRSGSKPRLAFAIDLEEGDLAGVPRLLERPMVKKINKTLSPGNTKMVWGFVDTLTKRFEMTERIEPIDAMTLRADSGEVTVDAEAVHLAIELEPHLEREGELEPPPDDDDALDPERDPASQAAVKDMVALNAEH